MAFGHAEKSNEKWSMDFVTDRLEDGRYFRILTVVDQFTRECVALHAGQSLRGSDVAGCLNQAIESRHTPQSITVDNGSEFCSQVMDTWAYRNHVQLDFIRPGKPVENHYIESFNGRLRDEFLNAHLFFDLEDAQEKLDEWRNDYNLNRPHANHRESRVSTVQFQGARHHFRVQVIIGALVWSCQFTQFWRERDVLCMIVFVHFAIFSLLFIDFSIDL